MIYVVLASMKESATRRDAMKRRLEFHFPDEVKIVGEYWLQATRPQVITIVDTGSPAAITATIAQWDDLYELDVFPALPAEEGLELAKHLFAREGLLV